MPLVRLPKNCTFSGLAATLTRPETWEGDLNALTLFMPKSTFLDAASVAFLCTWGLQQLSGGRRLALAGDPEVCRYLSRMDFHRHLGLPPAAEGQRRSEEGRFLPLRLVADGDDTYDAVNAVCDLILHQFDNAAELVPAAQWMLYEVIDNIVTHAEAPVPGAVYAQSYPNERRLDVAIVDVGRGVKASLSESRQVWSHGDALTQALQRGVTRGHEAGIGNGLAGTHEIAARNRGRFHIWTGDALYRLERGEVRGFTPLPELPGTGVLLSLDTRHPVDLADTWMASDEPWTYLDAEAERVISAGGLKVAKSCVDTEDREPAWRLCNKVRALLPSMREPLVIDFTGVDRTSSSFLDELLGRLVDELGVEGFKRSVQIIGLEPAIGRMVSDLVGGESSGE